MDWRNAIAMVTVRSTDSGHELAHGTAFLVTKNHALTSLHVVNLAKDGTITQEEVDDIEIFLTFTFAQNGPATRHETKGTIVDQDSKEDWALLQCEAVPPWAFPLPLVTTVNEDSIWKTTGFPILTDVNGLNVKGFITSAAGDYDGTRVIEVYSHQVAAGAAFRAEGFSGAPVVMARSAPGANKAGEESVVVGMIRTAAKDFRGHVQAGTFFACRIEPIIDDCQGVQLPDYDVWSRRFFRWIKRLMLRIFRFGGQFQLPVGFVRAAILAIIVCAYFLIQVWPENWAIPAQVKEEQIDCSVSFAMQDTEFQTDSFEGAKHEHEIAKRLLNEWKTWTLGQTEGDNYRYLVARLPKSFSRRVFSFDMEVRVFYCIEANCDDGICDESNLVEAKIDSAAAFLVNSSAEVSHGVNTPRYRQQLVFVDVVEDDLSKRRPSKVYFQAPYRGDNLLLLLLISKEDTLPADSRCIKVTLTKIEDDNDEQDE